MLFGGCLLYAMATPMYPYETVYVVDALFVVLGWTAELHWHLLCCSCAAVLCVLKDVTPRCCKVVAMGCLALRSSCDGSLPRTLPRWAKASPKAFRALGHLPSWSPAVRGKSWMASMSSRTGTRLSYEVMKSNYKFTFLILFGSNDSRDCFVWNIWSFHPCPLFHFMDCPRFKRVTVVHAPTSTSPNTWVLRHESQRKHTFEAMMCFCGGSFVIVMLLLTLRNLGHAMPCDYCRMERILNRNSYCNVQSVRFACFLPNIYIYI